MILMIDGEKIEVEDAMRKFHISRHDLMRRILAGARTSAAFKRKPSPWRMYMTADEIAARRKRNAANTFLYDFSADIVVRR